MRKHFAGIDIGSCSIELVLVDNSGKIVLNLQTDTNFDPMLEARKFDSCGSMSWKRSDHGRRKNFTTP